MVLYACLHSSLYQKLVHFQTPLTYTTTAKQVLPEPGVTSTACVMCMCVCYTWLVVTQVCVLLCCAL
jgi:hypothetical protein